jgi:hypothetical protein
MPAPHGNLQRLQNIVLRTIGNFPRRTPVRDLQVAFEIPYVYDFITELCSNKQVIQNHYNRNVRQGEDQHKKYKRLKLGGGHAYDKVTHTVLNIPLQIWKYDKD